MALNVRAVRYHGEAVRITAITRPFLSHMQTQKTKWKRSRGKHRIIHLLLLFLPGMVPQLGGLALFFQASLVKSPLNLRPFLGAHLYIKKMQLYFTLLFLHWTKWAVWPPGEALRFHDFGWILFYIKLRLRASISKWSQQTSDWQKVVSLWCCHKMT